MKILAHIFLESGVASFTRFTKSYLWPLPLESGEIKGKDRDNLSMTIAEVLWFFGGVIWVSVTKVGRQFRVVDPFLEIEPRYSRLGATHPVGTLAR